MTVHKYFGIEGSRQATGLTVIIDIFRAATVAAFLLDKGVEKILSVATPEEAFAYKAEHPDVILVGEDRGIKIPGFDYGNSPCEIQNVSDLKGKTVVHRSSQGTQGIVNAKQASEIIFGSFVTCQAIVDYIATKQPSVVSVVAMDGEGSEDDHFADYLIAKVTGKPAVPIVQITEKLRQHPGGARFLDPNVKEFLEDDFYLCLDVDAFDFVPLYQNGFITKHS